MLKQYKSKDQKGFTIIEVLIVLAIAGLILLIVFLAVPALQRNSRTTQYKNGASAVLGAVNKFVNNNQGQQPTTCAIAADGTVTISGAAGTTAATGRTQAGFTCAVGAALPAAGAATGAYTLILNQKCNGNTAITAATRSAAIGFTVETNTSTIQQCVDS